MNKQLSYLNQITLIIKESGIKACIVLIDKNIPPYIESLIHEGKINDVKVYSYEDEYFAQYREMSKEFKVAYVFKDGSIYVYDFERISEFMMSSIEKNSISLKGLSPNSVFIDEAID